MASVIGEAGRSANIQYLARRYGTLLAVGAASFVAMPLLAWGLGGISTFAGLVVALVLVAAEVWFFRARFIEIWQEFRDSDSWRRGAEGERRTGLVLDALPQGYVVFHDFHPEKSDGIAAWNIDHIVIGPSGFFVLDTKMPKATRIFPAAENTFTAKGVDQVQRNANELKGSIRRWSGGELDNLFVKPLLVFAQDNAFVVQRRERFVNVLPLKWLRSELHVSGPRRLNPDQVHRLALCLFGQLAPWEQEVYRQELSLTRELSTRWRVEQGTPDTLGLQLP